MILSNGYPVIMCVGNTPISSSTVSGVNSSNNFLLENPIVHRYLSNTYPSNYLYTVSTSASSFLDYKLKSTYSEGIIQCPYTKFVMELSRPCWTETPSPVILNTTGGTTITITSDSFSRTYDCQGNITYIYNLIPLTTYNYTVYDSNSVIINSGSFTTLGLVRMMKEHVIWNVRDIGGAVAGTGKLKYGIIFRGSNIEGLYSGRDDDSEKENYYQLYINSDLEDLKSFGVNAQLDLRSAGDANTNTYGEKADGRTVSNFGSDCSYYRYDTEGLSAYDDLFSTSSYYTAFAYYLDALLKELRLGHGLYINCALGADRTGTFVSIIEGLCGCSEDTVIKDWELTSFMSICSYRMINRRKSYGGTSIVSSNNLAAAYKWLKTNCSGNTLLGRLITWLDNKVLPTVSSSGYLLKNGVLMTGQEIANELISYLVE